MARLSSSAAVVRQPAFAVSWPLAPLHIVCLIDVRRQTGRVGALEGPGWAGL